MSSNSSQTSSSSSQASSIRIDESPYSSPPVSPPSIQRTRRRVHAVSSFWRLFDGFFGYFKYPYLVLAAVINLVTILDILFHFTNWIIICLAATARFFPVFEKAVGLVLVSCGAVMLARFIYGKTREGGCAGIEAKRDL